MKGKFLLLIFVSFFFLSCKKDKQSCSDGIFDSEKEEMTDCGGVCPPCSTDPNPVFSFLTVSVNGKSVYFGNYTLEKSSVWTLQFKNDSIDVKLNFGGGDSLGERPIESVGSSGDYRQLNYPVLYSGRSVFSEVNQEDNRLSAYFQAKFVAVNGIDTLFLSDGEFQNISW